MSNLEVVACDRLRVNCTRLPQQAEGLSFAISRLAVRQQLILHLLAIGQNVLLQNGAARFN
jgi:hypothetical protein